MFMKCCEHPKALWVVILGSYHCKIGEPSLFLEQKEQIRSLITTQEICCYV